MIFNARAWQQGLAGIPRAHSSGESVTEPARAGRRWQSRCHVSSAFSVSLIMDCVAPQKSPRTVHKKGPYSAVLSQTGSSLEVAVLACMSGIR